MKDKKFKVYTLEEIDNDSLSYVHWSKGLKMHIQKGDTTIVLEEDEIRKLVAMLPRTIGGSY
jgi:hypothetical protein